MDTEMRKMLKEIFSAGVRGMKKEKLRHSVQGTLRHRNADGGKSRSNQNYA